jgi:hypothetical protein
MTLQLLYEQLLYEWHAWPLRRNWTCTAIVSHGQAQQHPFPRICLLNGTGRYSAMTSTKCSASVSSWVDTKCCVPLQVCHYLKIKPETCTLSSCRFRTSEDLDSLLHCARLLVPRSNSKNWNIDGLSPV